MRRHLWRSLLAVTLGLAFGAWLIGCGDHETPSEPAPPEPAPTAVSPSGALRRLEWLFNHRSVDAYRTLLSDDFHFYCSPLDSAGSPWRGTPWTRDDELAFATHLLVGGGPELAVRSVQFTLDRNFFVLPDPEFPWDPDGRWHRNVRSTLTLNITFAAGDAYEIRGHANFYLVRGDSAMVPSLDPDSTCWYLRRWDDETAGGEGLLQAQPASNASLCEIRMRYR